MHEDFCGHKGTINPGDLQVCMIFSFVGKQFNLIFLSLSVDDSWKGDLAF